MIMRTTRNQRHKVHTKQTYSLKKLRTGKLVLALVGSFAVGVATIATSVNAAEWTARTVEEIKQDNGGILYLLFKKQQELIIIKLLLITELKM